MKSVKKIIFGLVTTLVTSNAFGQANPFINVITDNGGVVAVGCPLDIKVTIGNLGPSATIPQAKLRPIIEVPPGVTYLPTAQQTGLPAGWSIIGNNGSQIRLCNSLDPIQPATSRTIFLKVQGVNVAPQQPLTANIAFGNGNSSSCGPGGPVAGDNINDNSATSSVRVIASPTFSINNSLTTFSTTQGVPSNEQIFTLTGDTITDNIVVTAPAGYEVSSTSGSGYGSSITITPTNGSLSNTPVYIRLASSPTTGNVSGNVTVGTVSPNCIPVQNIPVTGNISGTPLPVKLIDFSLISGNCTAHLSWITSSEIDCEKFEIEKFTTSLGEWKVIGQVLAKNIASAHNTYHYTDDMNLASGKVLYRLKMIDKNGSFTYSQILNRQINCDKQSLSVFPNPVINGKLLVSVNGSEHLEAYLTSITGQKIKNINLKKGENIIDVSELSSGIYILNAVFANNTKEYVKVSIQQ